MKKRSQAKRRATQKAILKADVFQRRVDKMAAKILADNKRHTRISAKRAA